MPEPEAPDEPDVRCALQDAIANVLTPVDDLLVNSLTIERAAIARDDDD